MTIGLCGVGVIQNMFSNLVIFSTDRAQRQMWLYFGPGRCLWQEPRESIPDNEAYETLLIAGFPSGDKRVVFAQMEGLTGLKTKDSWDAKMIGMANEPFVKGNYPHVEGTWGWGNRVDKSVLAVRNIRATMVEYHGIKFDLKYPRNYEETQMHTDQLFQNFANPQSQTDFEVWRDSKVLGEIKRYGWFIDFWMENGLLRDISTNSLTTQSHWDMLRQPLVYTTEESHEQFEADRLEGFNETYDPLCINGTIPNGCEPVDVICADSLLDPAYAPAQIEKIGNILNSLDGVQDYVIPEDAWQCIWEELLVNKKGSMMDRENYDIDDYEFPRFLVEAMLEELNRLVSKYTQSPWSGQTNAQSLVMILGMHKMSLEEELASMP